MNNRAIIYGLLVGGLLLAAVATVISFAKIQEQIASSYSDPRPDPTRLIFDIHSNIHSVLEATNDYQFGEADGVEFSKIEVAFDIFWSMATHTNEGVVGRRFLQLPGAPRYLANLQTEIAEIESLLPGLRQRDMETFQQVQDQFKQFGSALNPLQLSATQSNDTYRDTVTGKLLSTLSWIFTLTFALVLIGAATGALIARDRILLARMQAILRRRVRAKTRELAQRNSELEATNARLRQFAYAASHDLQEPLRKIKLFSNDLVEQIGPKLTDEQDMAVVAINSSADRLQQLLQRLLTLGRVSHRPLEFETLDLDEIIADSLDYLDDEIKSSRAKIVIGPMPTITADTVQMRQLFRHLIGNALKFRAPDKDCRIQIAFTPKSGAQTAKIEIIDNGIGFPEEHGKRIFEAFRQLHSRTRYDGAGLGLAIAARIAETHGWRVTASGDLAKGATFTIHFGSETIMNVRNFRAA